MALTVMSRAGLPRGIAMDMGVNTAVQGNKRGTMGLVAMLLVHSTVHLVVAILYLGWPVEEHRRAARAMGTGHQETRLHLSL